MARQAPAPMTEEDGEFLLQQTQWIVQSRYRDLEDLREDILLRCCELWGDIRTKSHPPSYIEGIVQLSIKERKTADRRQANRWNQYVDCVRELGSSIRYFHKPQAANGKPVEMLSLDGEYVCRFDSMEEAARIVPGVDKSAVSRCANGHAKTHAGYRWRAAQD